MNKKIFLLLVLAILLCSPLFANVSSSGMPWENVLEKLNGWIVNGAKLLGGAIIIRATITFIGSGGQGFSQIVVAVVGLSIILGAQRVAEIIASTSASGALLF